MRKEGENSNPYSKQGLGPLLEKLNQSHLLLFLFSSIHRTLPFFLSPKGWAVQP